MLKRLLEEYDYWYRSTIIPSRVAIIIAVKEASVPPTLRQYYADLLMLELLQQQ